MPFEKVTSLDDLWSGELAGVVVGGRNVLLVNVDGQVYAYENRCVHQAVSLSEGRLDGHVLTCRAHEWQYDSRSGRGINPLCTQLERYAVEIQDGDVFVDVWRVLAERSGPEGGSTG